VDVRAILTAVASMPLPHYQDVGMTLEAAASANC